MNMIKLDWEEKTSYKYFLNNDVKRDIERINSFYPENVNVIATIAPQPLPSLKNKAYSILNIYRHSDFPNPVSRSNSYRGVYMRAGTLIYGPDELLRQRLFSGSREIIYANNKSLLKSFEKSKKHECIDYFIDDILSKNTLISNI
jgi:hypothetical protein